ncbi:MAG TPA: bifunctional diguanylate cyclase/phosphodiesterase [Solirubrobacteraceae bacterium]|nr:bifunctional diguanylate cyclase/phosphodiesterase [Solirubrobacteraceae bacterium]
MSGSVKWLKIPAEWADVALIGTDISPTLPCTELSGRGRNDRVGEARAAAHGALRAEIAPHVLRARRTAACTRGILGATGIALLLAKPQLLTHPTLGVAGFAIITASALQHLLLPRHSRLKVEESLAGAAAIMIVGLGGEHVTVLSILWLAAVASGVMGRSGRVHWIGRSTILAALALPIVLDGRLMATHAALCLASMGLLMNSVRLTRDLDRLLKQARYDADHDHLTGALSSAAFRAELERASARATAAAPVSLLLLDLDGFGVVNKTLGHAAGDALLATLGSEMREVIGPDCRLGRLGGDEFAVIVPAADPSPQAERLLETVTRCGEEAPKLDGCMGVAQAPRDGGGGEALLRASDIALRVAKRSYGAGRISHYAGESLSGEGARAALSRLIAGDGLSMAVQPIVDLRTMSVHAYEALARFGGQGASRSPVHWFSLAEEFGERDALERACLREALVLFRERPPEVRLSVNLSAPVLLDERTLQMLAEHADLDGLIVEITEEALVRGDGQLQAAIGPLRERGACLAVDDMGAGYSGLRQITTVHPSYLKLDRSLVSGIDTDDDRTALVGALVSYAEHVGSLLVAEGIERPAELQRLRELEVPLAQGFHLGRPAPPWPELAAGRDTTVVPTFASS